LLGIQVIKNKGKHNLKLKIEWRRHRNKKGRSAQGSGISSQSFF